MQKAARGRPLLSGTPAIYFEAALEAAVAALEAAAAELAASDALEAALEAASAAAEAAGAGAGAAAGAGAGAGAGSSFLPQADRAAAATRVARTSDFFISGFLIGDVQEVYEIYGEKQFPEIVFSR
jgi:multidrug resistance efflux pump